MAENNEVKQEIQYHIDISLATMERTNRRVWIAFYITLFMLLVTNLSWFLYENSFEEITITQENENGYNSFIGNDGDIVYYGDTDNQN